MQDIKVPLYQIIKNSCILQEIIEVLETNMHLLTLNLLLNI
nr:MAG TPA: hypothetical protein [Caudoviricetes sp.]